MISTTLSGHKGLVPFASPSRRPIRAKAGERDPISVAPQPSRPSPGARPSVASRPAPPQPFSGMPSRPGVILGPDGQPLEVIPVEKTGDDAWAGVARVDRGDRQEFDWRNAAALASGDLVALLVFAAAGRANHGEPLSAETFTTALPFLLGWFTTAPFMGGFGVDARKKGVPAAALTAAKCWAVGIPAGVLLRSLFRGYVPPLTFIGVGLAVNGVLLVGWRSAFAALTKPEKPASVKTRKDKRGYLLAALACCGFVRSTSERMSSDLKELGKDLLVKSYLQAIQKYKQQHRSSLEASKSGPPTVPSAPVNGAPLVAFSSSSLNLGAARERSSTIPTANSEHATSGRAPHTAAALATSARYTDNGIIRKQSTAIRSTPVCLSTVASGERAGVSSSCTSAFPCSSNTSDNRPRVDTSGHPRFGVDRYLGATSEPAGHPLGTLREQAKCHRPALVKAIPRTFEGTTMNHTTEPIPGGAPVSTAALQQQPRTLQQQHQCRHWNRRPPPPPPPSPPLLPWPLITSFGEIGSLSEEEIWRSFEGGLSQADQCRRVAGQYPRYRWWPSGYGHDAFSNYGQNSSYGPW